MRKKGTMGKTPKKAAPGGDERNLYNRRLKATTAPSNSSETSLHKRQREYEISNRFLLNTLKKIPPGQQCKNIEVRLGKPPKLVAPKKLGRAPTSFKQKKLSPPDKGEEATSQEMQPESEETEVKHDSEKEDTKKDADKNNQDQSGKEKIDGTPMETVSNSKEEDDSVNKEMEEGTESQEKINHSEKEKDKEERGDDLSLRFEPEENVSNLNSNGEKVNDKDTKEEGSEVSASTATEVTKDGGNEKEDVLSESQTDTESYSAEVLEATTSEVSEASENASQNDLPKEKEKREQSLNKDLSFVSYDPSITLKDVQIKLNDCLKESSRAADTSISSVSSPPNQMNQASFGKTLRNISGRRSLTRMRHVTVRDRRYSPSDSMFVNTSNASPAPEETTDFKIMRYHHTALDLSTNGSPAERKRKHELEEWSSGMKKQKTDSEYSLLNSSISLLKGFRRPIQVSTPVSELKFQTGKLELSDESKSSNEGKKWCAIM